MEYLINTNAPGALNNLVVLVFRVSGCVDSQLSVRHFEHLIEVGLSVLGPDRDKESLPNASGSPR